MKKLTHSIRTIIEISMIRSRKREIFYSDNISWINLLSQWESSLKHRWSALEKEEDFIQIKSVGETYFLDTNDQWNIDD